MNDTLKHSMLYGLFSDALQMVKVSYALTLSATMIPYSKGSNDDALFEGIVQGMVRPYFSLPCIAVDTKACSHFSCSLKQFEFVHLKSEENCLLYATDLAQDLPYVNHAFFLTMLVLYISLV